MHSQFMYDAVFSSDVESFDRSISPDYSTLLAVLVGELDDVIARLGYHRSVFGRANAYRAYRNALEREAGRVRTL